MEPRIETLQESAQSIRRKREKNTPVFETALAMLQAGFSVLPCNHHDKFHEGDNPKKPTVISWTPYQKKTMTLAEAKKHFVDGVSIGVICGKVSGNLECLDFDQPELYKPFMDILEGIKPELAAVLVKRQTPAGGYHLIYRSESPVSGSLKLAISEDGKKTLIETRGEGAYFLTAPSPGYKIIKHSLLNVPIITSKDVDLLHSIAKSFTQKAELARESKEKKAIVDVTRPRDDFNQKVDFCQLLENHGWQSTRRTRPGGEHWTRPGKKHGTSATLKDGCLYVFSSNAGLPLGPNDAFSVHTHLNHGGDYTAAVKELVKKGYGEKDFTVFAVSQGDVSGAENSLPDPVFLDDNPAIKISHDVFPEAIGEMVEATSKATETPMELPAQMALAALATCNQQKFQVMADQDYYEPLNLWAVAALDPGNRKSAVIKIITQPLLDWDIEQAEATQAEIRRLQEERENKLARIKILRGNYAKAEAANLDEIEKEILGITESLPEVPVIPRVWTQDITPEKLGDIMAEQGEKMSILSSEGGVFDTIAGRYSNGIPNLDIYLQAHAGDPVRVDRQSRSAIFMRNPTLSMGLSPQPEVLHGLSSKPGFRGRGLLARFLYALPLSPLGNRKLETTPIPDAIKSRYHNTLTALLSIPPVRDDKGIIKPFTLTLTDDARREWKDFSMVVERDMRGGGRFENIMDWASKLPGAALRIAGNFHCALNAYHQPWSMPITQETMNNSLQYAAILAEHALLVFGYMGADKSLEAAKKVWSWVERNRQEQFTARDCFQALKGTYKRMDDLNPAINVLIERYYILEQDKEGKPGRPSRIFTVHPKIGEGWI